MVHGLSYKSSHLKQTPPTPAHFSSMIDDNTFQHVMYQQTRLDQIEQASLSFWEKKKNFTSQRLNIIIRKKSTKCDLVNYSHAACFFPVKSTFLRAIRNNHFLSIPGLSTKLVTHHLSSTRATAMGHTKEGK